MPVDFLCESDGELARGHVGGELAELGGLHDGVLHLEHVAVGERHAHEHVVLVADVEHRELRALHVRSPATQL